MIAAVWAIVVAFVLVAFILFALMLLDPLSDDEDDTTPGFPADRRNK